jgi:hypothetical protein
LVDEQSSDDWANDDRQAFDDRLHRHTRRMPIRRERSGDERKCRGQGKAAPREEKEHSQQHRAPVRHKGHEGIACDRDHIEENERALMPPAIREDASRPGVQCAKQSFQRIEKANHKHARTQRL